MRIRKNTTTQMTDNSKIDSPNEKNIEASRTEIFIKRYIAPELISTPGKISVLLIYAILTCVSLYGISMMRIYYGWDLYVNEGYISYEFSDLKREYFPRTFEVFTFVYSPAQLIYTEEA